MTRRILLSIMLTMLFVPLFAQDEAGSSIASRTILNSRGTQTIEQRVYDNGLGDIIQEVLSYPGSSIKSLVTHHEYDEYRRKTKTWLPVPSSGSDFVSRKSIQNTARSQYSDDKAYSLTEYDEFHQLQPSSQYKAGSKWQDANKKVTVTYDEYVGVGIYTDGLEYIYTLSGIKLFGTRTVDEDGVLKADYKDRMGRLIMTETNQGKTFYLYNMKDDVCYVIPPALSKYIIDNHVKDYDSIEDTDEMMQKYAYIYRYDYKRNCIYKKLPGCDPIYYVYDKVGTCILSQDGNQRQKGEWTYSIPDKFGRPCVSGVCRNNVDYMNNPLRSVHVFAEYDGTSVTTGGYNVNNFVLDTQTMYFATYYDKYTFIGKHGVPNTLASSNASNITSLGQGLQTGSAIAVLKDGGVSGYTYSAMYYNSRWQVSQVVTKNHIGGKESTETTYTYTGKPSKVLIRRDLRQAGASECYTYSYDRADRLQTVTHKLDGGSERTIIQNTYNSLGQLSNQKNGNRTTYYSYDIHSWLTRISTQNNYGQFEEKLAYADSEKPCYNGNISSMSWKASNSTQRNYDFVYDSDSRLLSAQYSEGSQRNSNKNNFSTQYEYDCMGNIMSIKRNGLQDGGTYGKIDDLTLNYDGNQLMSVRDAVTDPTYNNVWNFTDGANPSVGNEYEYDKNGNVIKDLNRGISRIQYNTLNLPYEIQYSDGKIVKYTYSADGHKLSAEYITTMPATSKMIHYCGNLIIEDGKPKHLSFEGGYIPLDDWSMTYRYYVKDHLGNNRMVIHEAGMIEQVNNYYPFGGLMSNSSGWNAQRFKYNGKEFDRMNGLDWYDYGARWQDPSVGRWHSMDPLCEKYYNVSPYVYCLNNPLINIDPDGRNNFRLNRDGNVDLIEETEDDFDLIFSVDKNGNDNLNNPFVASKNFFANTISTTVKGKASDEFGGGVSEYNVTIYNNTDKNESASFFEFASNNTDVEWSYVETSEFSSVGTSNSSGDDVSNAYMMWNAARNNIPVIRNIHSHSYGNNTPSYGDVNFAKQYSQQPLNAPNTQFYIYDRVGYHSYDKNSSVMPFEFVVTGTLRKSK